MRKILCNNSEHPRVFAHLLDNGTIDIVRQEQRFTVLGKDFTMIGTNPQGTGKTVLTVANGILVEDNLTFKENDDAPTPQIPEDDK